MPYSAFASYVNQHGTSTENCTSARFQPLTLWTEAVLFTTGIPPKLVTLIKSLHKGHSTMVQFYLIENLTTELIIYSTDSWVSTWARTICCVKSAATG